MDSRLRGNDGRDNKIPHNFESPLLRKQTAEIEFPIHRLRRRRRHTRIKQLARQQVILGRVDAVDRQQFPTAQMKHREAAAIHVAAHDPLVGAARQAGGLQFLVVLVAPEPRRCDQRTLLSEQRGGGGFPLLGGVLHRFQPQQTAVRQTARSAVAGCHHIWRRGAGQASTTMPRSQAMPSACAKPSYMGFHAWHLVYRASVHRHLFSI